MTDTTRPDETPQFETDEVSATRAREQGLGLGARELAAQRDPGGVQTADEADDAETDPDGLDQSVALQGSPD